MIDKSHKDPNLGGYLIACRFTRISPPLDLFMDFMEAAEFQEDQGDRGNRRLVSVGIATSVIGVVLFSILAVGVMSDLGWMPNLLPFAINGAWMGIVAYPLTVVGIFLIITNIGHVGRIKWSIRYKRAAPAGMFALQILLLILNIVVVLLIVAEVNQGRGIRVTDLVTLFVMLTIVTIFGFLGASGPVFVGLMQLRREFRWRSKSAAISVFAVMLPLLLAVILSGDDLAVWPGVAVTSIVAWLGYMGYVRRSNTLAFRELVGWLVRIRNLAIAQYSSSNIEVQDERYMQLVHAFSEFQVWMLHGPVKQASRIESDSLFSLCRVMDGRICGVEDPDSLFPGRVESCPSGKVLCMDNRSFAIGVSQLFDVLLRSIESSFSRGIPEVASARDMESREKSRSKFETELRRLSRIGTEGDPIYSVNSGLGATSQAQQGSDINYRLK